jgi:non-homologous end joining protein Ku
VDASDTVKGYQLGKGEYIEIEPRRLRASRSKMRPFPADLRRMWPISSRIDKPENDDPSIVEPIEAATSA